LDIVVKAGEKSREELDEMRQQLSSLTSQVGQLTSMLGMIKGGPKVPGGESSISESALKKLKDAGLVVER
jgi:hypothetical protein